jgi:hypothetical protein
MRIDNIMVNSVGFSLLILALLRGFDYITLNNTFVIGISFSAISYSLKELYFFAYKDAINEEKKNIIEVLSYFLMVFFIVAFPQIPLNSDTQLMNSVSDFATLFTFGMLIIALANKSNDKIDTKPQKSHIDS